MNLHTELVLAEWTKTRPSNITWDGSTLPWIMFRIEMNFPYEIIHLDRLKIWKDVSRNVL